MIDTTKYSITYYDVSGNETRKEIREFPYERNDYTDNQVYSWAKLDILPSEQRAVCFCSPYGELFSIEGNLTAKELQLSETILTILSSYREPRCDQRGDRESVIGAKLERLGFLCSWLVREPDGIVRPCYELTSLGDKLVNCVKSAIAAGEIQF